ncbi:endo-1,4-beta-xylanase [Cellulomonas aerilata]|uniref:Beta-xylanase n=1 Tax=Cellulomonas aerilata TaxID=515326 RepID=A0A512DB09_9CELL|nr:endo-1,4-beta-xylanase [Cellulomonas aerilata]GEO33671.1 hypothetical protein CAE01nite_13960 [Cellulomonas aerilata]
MSRPLTALMAVCAVVASLVTGVGSTAQAADVTVLSTDFENGDVAPWTQSGGPTLSVVDADGDKALLVSNRANDYDGITSPANLLRAGTAYTFSMQAKLAPGTEGSAGIRFVVQPAFTWVGNTTMTADAWTTVTGTFTAPAGADPASLRAYIGTGDLGAAYSYLVDDIRITGPAAGPTTVSSDDFEDASFSPWTQSGGPALSFPDADGDTALLVAGRANDYDGIQSPAGLLKPGTQYTLSMQAKLAEGTPGSAGIRFVVKPAFDWVGNATMTAAGWTTVSGTFTAPAGTDPAALQVYIGTDALSDGTTAAYSYLVDDVRITAPAGTSVAEPWTPTPDPAFVPGGAVDPTTTPVSAARGNGNVAALTFDDGPNTGGETAALLDVLKAEDVKATFCVIGSQVRAPGGAELLKRIVAEGHTLCNHSATHADMASWTHAQVETDLKANLAIIRSALGDPQQKVPYWRAPNGSWGVTGEVAAALGMQPLGLGNVISDWDGNDLSEATLTANLRKAVTPGAVVLVHDGPANRANGIAAVRTVVSERLAAGWTFALPQGGIAPATAPTTVTSTFEDGTDGWGPRGGATTALSTDAHQGTGSLSVTDRAQAFEGATLDVTGALPVGTTVGISVWAKLPAGAPSASLKVSVQRNTGTAENYDSVVGGVVTAGGWTQLKGTYTLGGRVDRAQVYVEGDAGVSFLIDDFSLAPIVLTPIQDIPALKDVLGAQGIEHVSAAIDQRETVGRPSQLFLKHFDTFSPENDGKPEVVQPTEGTFNFTNLDRLLDYADANDVQVYGHVLVWHSQTPAWFFKDGARDLTSSPADQAILRARMERHIKGIADHIDARYPNGDSPIWAWDVVNEVIDDGETDNPHDMRSSRWFQVLGESFVDDAFRLADTYFPAQKLFINDYNTEMPTKRADYLELVAALQARGVPIDGVGHQAHVDFARPVQWLDESLTAVEQLDPTLLQVITELDVSSSKENNGADVSAGTVPQHSAAMPAGDAETEVGYYYRDMFAMLRTHADSLESVTFWGLDNARSWLRTWPAARPWESPLPFDDDLQATPAYWGIVDPARLATRPADVLPPRIGGHDTVTAVASDSTGAVVRYDLPEAGDTRDGVLTPTCSPASGSRFPVGTTTVTCSATDAAGNAARPGTFRVVVTKPVVDLTAVVTGPSTVRAGGTASYALTVTNAGPSTAEGVTAVLSTTGLSKITAGTGAGAGSATVNGTKLTGMRVVVPTLAPGASVTVTVTGKVDGKKGSTVTAVGGAVSTTTEQAPADNLSRLVTTVTQ